MNRYHFRLLLFLLTSILARAPAFADGGTLQLRKEDGGLVIFVFTAPAPLCAGVVDVSVLVQTLAGLEPVLDAEVSMLLRNQASGAEIRARLTRERAQNKLLYAAPVTLAESGDWSLSIAILRKGSRTEMTGAIKVAPPRAILHSYFGYVALPPVLILGFVVREWLIRRQPRLRPA